MAETVQFRPTLSESKMKREVYKVLKDVRIKFPGMVPVNGFVEPFEWRGGFLVEEGTFISCLPDSTTIGHVTYRFPFNLKKQPMWECNFEYMGVIETPDYD